MSPLPSDMVPPQQDYLLRRISDLERQVRELAAARGLQSSTISSGGIVVDAVGGIRVMHDNGEVLFDIGTVQTAFGPVEEMRLRRRDGTVSLQVFSNLFGFEACRVLDTAGAVIFSDDGTSGRGLDRPYVPHAFTGISAVPTDTTTGAVFVALQRAVWWKQHPLIQFTVRTNVTSTTAEIRFRIASGPDIGSIIAGPLTISTGTAQTIYGPYSILGNHLANPFDIDIEARVASGAGLIGVSVMSATGLGNG